VSNGSNKFASFSTFFKLAIKAPNVREPYSTPP